MTAGRDKLRRPLAAAPRSGVGLNNLLDRDACVLFVIECLKELDAAPCGKCSGKNSEWDRQPVQLDRLAFRHLKKVWERSHKSGGYRKYS